MRAPVGAATLSSAALLFVVQPMLAKTLLPAFGGSAMVWTTSMLFFQWLLLAGYGYCFWLTRSSALARQFDIHRALLLLGIALVAAGGFSVAPSSASIAAAAHVPIAALVLALTLCVGLPYFLLATTSPLLQSWLARGGTSPRVYRLYALSNIGSIGGLLAFPLLIEPRIGLEQQTHLWALAFIAWALLMIWIAGRMRRSIAPAVVTDVKDSWREQLAPKPKRFDPLLLSAISSMLLLTFTAQLTQDIAAIPLLWVVPLSIYLFSFVLCFDGQRWYWKTFYRIAAVAVPLVLIASQNIYIGGPAGVGIGLTPVHLLIPMFWVALFLLCMFCHGELALQRPTGNPTGFYLTIALGSALGAAVVALIAPLLLPARWELPVLLAFIPILAALRFKRWGTRLSAPAVALTIAAALIQMRTYAIESVDYQRSLYSSVRVQDAVLPDGHRWRKLMHGAILHGAQATDDPLRLTTYYAQGSGVHIAFDTLRAHRSDGLRVAVIGLGTGTLAAYGRPGDAFVFYELDPMVYQVATKHFSYLRDSQAKLDYRFGDGRLNLKNDADRRFDMIIVDAFSSDAVPVHLLTREAMQMYSQRLTTDGSILLHISNKYLHLEPVAAWAGAAIDHQAILFDAPAATEDPYSLESTWVLVTGDQRLLTAPSVQEHGNPLKTPRPIGRWTDDYSNLIEIFR